MKLSLEIIEKYELKKSNYTPDYDDKGYTFTLPCGIDVSGFFMINGGPCDMECLEGMDGYLYIETEEELKELIAMDFKQLSEKVLAEHPEADLSNYE